MKRHSSNILIWILTLSFSVASAAAQAEKASQAAKAAPAAETGTAPTSGFRAEFLKQLGDVEKKTVSLAQAEPDAKFTWRPGEGVRSVSEVYMHLAGANYLLPTFVGVKAPAGLSREMEKVTDKAKVLDTLKQSFEHARQAILNTPDADLDKVVKFFGRDATVREVFFAMANHMHEHLGQSIAYARMTGVVPPWTAEQQQR